MTRQHFNSLSTEALKKRKILSYTALLIVCLGASMGIMASIYRFILDGTFSSETFVLSILALMASTWVFNEKKLIVEVLNARNK